MPLWHITAKDLYLLARDRRTFAVLLMLPLVFIVIIGASTGQLLGLTSSNQVLKIIAVDEIDYDAIGTVQFLTPPGGAAPDAEPPQAWGETERAAERNRARHIVAGVLNGIQRSPGVEVRTAADWARTLGLKPPQADGAEAARELVNAGDVDAAVIFTPDFYRKVHRLRVDDLIGATDDEGDDGGPTAGFDRIGIELLDRTAGTATASATAAIVAWHIRDVLTPVLYCKEPASVPQRASARYRAICDPVREMDSAPPPELLPPARGDTSAIGNMVYQELVPSYTVMFVFFLVNIMARSFLHERELGTMRRLRIAPVAPWQVMLGKTLPFLVVSLAQTALLFGAGRLFFGMSWGADPWMLLPVIFATSCAATGLGLLIATLIKTDSQVSAYATTAVIVLAGISGCFMPRKWLPDLMQDLSLATPHAWALIAYDQLLSTTTPRLATVWQCVGALFAFAAVFLALGALRFRQVEK